jgi:hypothetical protein
MKDFSNPSLVPEVISVMDVALDAAVASLPKPVARVNFLPPGSGGGEPRTECQN